MPDPDRASAESPSPSRDPRLEIPQVLRTPVRKPASIEEAAGTRSRSNPDNHGNTVEMVKGWTIALSFVYTLVGGGLIGWLVAWLVPSWKPWPVLVGLLVGLILGFVRFIREAIAASNSTGKRSTAPRSRRPE